MRELRDSVRGYYAAKLERHGPTPRGVDWPNAISQQLRFVQLLKLCDFGARFSLNDLGCGYGALLDFLAERHSAAAIDYRGIDLSPEMVAAARSAWTGRRHTTFATGAECGQPADYSLASGIFNVRLGHPIAAWEGYVEEILADLHGSSRIGFAVNFMRPHEMLPMEDGLYRTEPARWMRFCEVLGGKVELIADYGLREFTLLVRQR